jgi:hypothetical protein
LSSNERNLIIHVSEYLAIFVKENNLLTIIGMEKEKLQKAMDDIIKNAFSKVQEAYNNHKAGSIISNG